MADLERLKRALQAAHAAGDTAAASEFAKAIRSSQASKPVDTSMGTAFKLGDLEAQISGREGKATLGRLADDSVFGDVLRFGRENIANPVREALGFDPINQDEIESKLQSDALNQAQALRAERDKLQKATNFKNLTTDDINSVSSFVDFVTQKLAQSGPQMLAAVGSGGYATYPFMVGELTEAQKNLEGLTQEQKDRTAALGGLVMTALENLGIAKLLPKGTSTSIIGGIANGSISEGTTEGLQELIKIGVEYNAGKKFADGEVLNRLKEAAAAGGAAGGSIKGGVNTATKVSKIFTSDGKVNQPGDLDTDSAKAAGDFARRLRTIADANGYDLKDVGAGSTKGARETVDKAHIQMTEELKKLFRDLGDAVRPTDKETFQETTDKILAQAAYREARNKTKSTVGQQEIDAMRRLVGNTAEGQQALNLMLQLNQLTEVHNEGYKGGLSRFTDVFNPFDQNINSYDGASRIVTGTLSPIATVATGVATGGSSVLPQAGIYGSGRAIDKLTGRRSRVDRYVRRNERKEGLSDPTGPSVVEAERIRKQQADEAAKRSEEETAALNLELTQKNAPPTPDSPQFKMEDATGLDRGGVARILRVLKGSNKSKALSRAITEYEQSVATGGRIKDLSPLIRAVRQFQEENPDYVPQVRPPNSLSNPQAASAPNAGGQTYGPRYTTPENYNRGIQNNIDANRQLAEGVVSDPDLDQAQKAQLLTSLDALGSNLGADPVSAAQAQVTRLQEAGVPQAAIDMYVIPYVNRVAGQQSPRQSTSRLAEMEADAAEGRLGMDYKDVTQRIPELQEGQRKLQANEITKEDYEQLVNKYKPVMPYTTTPDPETADDATYALSNGKGQSEAKAAKYGEPSKVLKEGERVQLRLDIPSYSQHGTWVVSVHRSNSSPDSTSESRFKAGPVVGYESVGRIKNADLGMLQGSAQKIASGSAKGTIATMLGDYVPMTPQEASQYVNEVLPRTLEPGSGYAQVGMDPERHSYFYDRNTMEPIVSASDIVQIGPLVVAKDPVYAPKLSFRFNKRPNISDMVEDQAPILSGKVQGSDLRISTRFPTQKASTEDPISGNLIVDTESMKATPQAFEHNMDLVTEYVNFPVSKIGNRDPDQIAKDFKEMVVRNLLWLHDKVPAPIRKRSKLWYDGARAITTRWSEKYGIPDQGIAGVLAALSPQKDWYQNVSLAERVLDTMTGQVDTLWSQKMSDTAAEIFAKPQYALALQEIQGKTLREVMDLNNDGLTAMWIRTFDEAHNDRRYRTVSSEGNFIGKPSGKAAWGSLSEIGKAVSVVRDPSYENVTVQMGARHKVRNFYNNIISPNSLDGDVTIDTHAVAAGLLRPLSGNSTEVSHNFGTSPSKKKQPVGYRAAKASGITGSQGLYGIYADAYREAAARRGIKPREMQSITWEAVRGLFPAKWKQKKNVKAVEDIWKQYRNGDISISDARNAVEKLAGGIDDPTWYAGPNSTNDAEVSDTSYAGQLDSPGVAGYAEGVGGGARGRDPRLSKRSPTGGLRGILSNALQGANPRPSTGSPPPSDGAVRQQYRVARAPFEIGKPGTELENGIKNIEQLNRLAEANKIGLKAYTSQRTMIKELAPGYNIDKGTAGIFSPAMNTAGYLLPGVKRGDGGVGTENEVFLTALHELAHGIADKQADGSLSPYNVRMYNALNLEEEVISKNSFDYQIGLILGKSPKEMNEIRDEIINLQDKVNFTFADGSTIPTRDFAAFEAKYNEMAKVRDEKFRRKWGPIVRDHRKYVRNISEMAVDPLSWYLFDPTAFKKEAPKTAKMMRDFFNESGSIRFYNHPLAMGVAVILAMLMQADQDDEKKRMIPPGVLNQPMQAGALSA
jgi:hypothetical protein